MRGTHTKHCTPRCNSTNKNKRNKSSHFKYEQRKNEMKIEREENILDLFVDGGLTLIGILMASERGLRDAGYEHELLLHLFEWLENDAG